MLRRFASLTGLGCDRRSSVENRTSPRRQRRATPEVEGLEGRQLLSTITNKFSGQVLDDPASSLVPGIGIIQWFWDGGVNQQWKFQLLNNGNFKIQDVASGLVLDDPASSPYNGTNIIQWFWNGGANQQWRLIPVYPYNGYFEIQNVASGKVLDDPNYSLVPGTGIIQWDWNGGANQQWYLDWPLLVDTSTIMNGASGLVLDDPNYSGDNGTQIIQYYLNLGFNQQWNFFLLNNGNFEIQNVWSGKVLDDPRSSPYNGTGIIQWDWNDGANQQWKLVPIPPIPALDSGYGYFMIVNVASGKVLTDPGSSHDAGTGIIQEDWNGGDNQQWSITGLF